LRNEIKEVFVVV